MYAIVITTAAKRFLEKLDKKTRSRIVKAIMQLQDDARPPGCKKLKGVDAYRIRIGDYRVIYDIEDEVLRITVVKVGHRKDIYDF